MTQLHQETHLRMLKFYPKALETALASYRKIARKPEIEYLDIKKQQEACKVAIAHIQLLLKVGADLSKGTVSESDAQLRLEQEQTGALIAAAQEEISRNYDDNSP